MSWPIASFAIVFGVLLVGWLAYERSRPSARMAAVVGTLAAIAALGRDAFVAIPDVKPITAMTLVVGYALGPLPGFTVGAVGMLASNILLGQGSYTPWQMAAWGLVGLAGAALGRLSRRRMGRVALALACALTAMVAKEIMNVYTWTLGASHTPAALLATAGAALPFDITDAVASFLFGLAFAPELARLLGRMRARMTVTWQPAVTPLVLLALAGSIALGGELATSQPARGAATGAHRTGTRAAIAGAIDFLARAQNADGGFGGEPGQRSSELYSAWSAIGLAAAGREPLAFKRDGHDLLDSIEAQASTLNGAGDLERTILALRACGASIRDFMGSDLVTRLLRFRSPDGSFGQLVNLTAFAILALRAADEPADSRRVRVAARWLAEQQKPDGGFSYAVHGVSDVDDTAAALQGVVAASVPSGPVVSQAIEFLGRAQNDDGGYPQELGGESNAQSTSWAIQGLAAAGRNPGRAEKGGRSPIAYLRKLIAADGSVRYSTTSEQTPVWVTAEALAALARKPLPIAPTSTGRRSHPAPRSSSGHTSSRSVPNRVKAPVHKHSPVSSRGSRLSRGQLNSVARGAGRLLGFLLAPVLR